eukprot:scaffold715_cov164-Amphora_coffeaeformis.AAC.5
MSNLSNKRLATFQNLGVIPKSFCNSHSVCTVATTRIPVARAKSPRTLGRVVNRPKNPAPTKAPNQEGTMGILPPQNDPTTVMASTA